MTLATLESIQKLQTEAYGVERWLGELAEDLRKRTYRSQAVRRVYLKKSNGRLRPIAIPPDMHDRIKIP